MAYFLSVSWYKLYITYQYVEQIYFYIGEIREYVTTFLKIDISMKTMNTLRQNNFTHSRQPKEFLWDFIDKLEEQRFLLKQRQILHGLQNHFNKYVT